MANNNSLVKQQEKRTEKLMVQYTSNGEEVKLTPQIVKDYLVSGNNKSISDQEIAMFMNLCKYNGLNPWLKEAYCIKYGSEPATLVTSKEAMMKRAESHPQFDGYNSGIIILDNNGEITYRTGNVHIPGEEIIGGWCEVFRKDRTHSARVEVPFEEYAGRKKDGSMNSNWTNRPGTMIRKVAIVQALREAFPCTLSGMYSADERAAAETVSVPSAAPEPVKQEKEPEIVEAEILDDSESIAGELFND